MDYQTRAEREKSQYNEKTVKRDVVNKYFAHANALLSSRIYGDARKEMHRCNGKKALEIGCEAWNIWLEGLDTAPRELHCINISEAELATGSQLAEGSTIKPVFHLMDAHRLDFPDDSFDVVFGGAILHHLNLSTALPEIQRVLKPGGFFLFAEPLNINPVSKTIRYLTPKARTLDERALGFRDLRAIGAYIDSCVTGYQLFSIPLNFLSLRLYGEAENPIMRFADFLDTSLQRFIPFLKYYYRYALITGYKRLKGAPVR
jgi:ubiquinone/menaquinone biosynthesis C-methylase UbiE